VRFFSSLSIQRLDKNHKKTGTLSLPLSQRKMGVGGQRKWERAQKEKLRERVCAPQSHQLALCFGEGGHHVLGEAFQRTDALVVRDSALEAREQDVVGTVRLRGPADALDQLFRVPDHEQVVAIQFVVASALEEARQRAVIMLVVGGSMGRAFVEPSGEPEVAINEAFAGGARLARVLAAIGVEHAADFALRRVKAMLYERTPIQFDVMAHLLERERKEKCGA